jgi:hypothetical protein
MKNILLVPLLSLFVAAILTAQAPQQTTPSVDIPYSSEIHVDAPTLHQWLHSGNPRMIAWAADFARCNHEKTIVAEMPEALEQMVIPAEWQANQTESADQRAVLAVLDALIQEKADVPLTLINRISSALPAQAAILLAQKPLTESRELLESWTLGERVSFSNQSLARIATMLLAKDPLSSQVLAENWQKIGLVASVVDASEEELYIVVRADVPNSGYGNGGGTCGDSLSKPLTPGWPVVYAYRLGEANQQPRMGSILVDMDGDKIYYDRSSENGGWGSCSGQEVQPLNAATRHRLLAYWLGVPEKEMTWKAHEVATILWTTQSEYENELGRVVNEHRRNLEATVKALVQKGLLKEEEQATPKLVVKFKCIIKPCPLN